MEQQQGIREIVRIRKSFGGLVAESNGRLSIQTCGDLSSNAVNGTNCTVDGVCPSLSRERALVER